MSIAYPVSMVQVEQSVGMNDQGVGVGTRWLTGNLLFRGERDGRAVREEDPCWAMARDTGGRQFVIWPWQHSLHHTLVIQRTDSLYCYEVFPLDG